MRTGARFFLFLAAFAVLLFPGGLSWAESDIDFELAVPADAVLQDQKDIIHGGRPVKSFLYYTQQSDLDTAEFFRRSLAASGFQNIMDQRNPKTGEVFLRFKKGDKVATISVKSKDGSTRIVAGKHIESPGSLPLEQLRPTSRDTAFSELPKEDLPGQDISFIPRPPDSIRLASPQPNLFYTAYAYQTKLTPAQAADFYRSSMPAYGWKMVSDRQGSDVVEEYNREARKMKKGKELKLSPSLKGMAPVEGGLNIEKMISQSAFMSFESSRGKADINVVQHYAGPDLGSMVTVLFTKSDSSGY